MMTNSNIDPIPMDDPQLPQSEEPMPVQTPEPEPVQKPEPL